MTRWAVFAALTLFLLAFVLFSARRSQGLVSELTAEPAPDAPAVRDGAGHLDAVGGYGRAPTAPTGPQLSSMALLANVGVSHALFAAVLLAGIWLADVPIDALGVGAGVTGMEAVGVGIAVGLVIAAVNTLLGGVLDGDPSAKLRELLTPGSPVGWVVLFVVVLPIIAGFEELLFRAVLIGAFSAGFELSPWLLAVASSVAFAAGHGAQGRLGIAATGVLGFVLAAVFVATESLLVVVVAHYIINAVEFGLGGIGYEPFER